MKVHYNLENIQKEIKTPVLTIGTFDGVHVGHQKIINKLKKIAQEKNGSSVLFTFHPHPRKVLFPEGDSLKLIQTQEEKIDKLDSMGLDHLILFPFSKAFSRLSATEFVRDYLVNKIGVATVVIGYDHHFGRNREGTLEHLKELAPVYQFDIHEISAEDVDDVNVSSTKIRKAILNGDFETATKFLGEPFEMNGIIVDGDKIGRTIGYPTANIQINDEDKIRPKFGVYIVKVYLNDQEYFGMASYGVRPSIEDNKLPQLEVYILDFDDNIYGEEIKLSFLTKIRDEIKFNDLEALKNQINKDEEYTKNWIADTTVY